MREEIAIRYDELSFPSYQEERNYFREKGKTHRITLYTTKEPNRCAIEYCVKVLQVDQSGKVIATLKDVTTSGSNLGKEMTDTEMLDWLEEQTRKSSTGISFDRKGDSVRFMRRHFLGEHCPDLRSAIRHAKYVADGGPFGKED